MSSINNNVQELAKKVHNSATMHKQTQACATIPNICQTKLINNFNIADEAETVPRREKHEGKRKLTEVLHTHDLGHFEHIRVTVAEQHLRRKLFRQDRVKTKH